MVFDSDLSLLEKTRPAIVFRCSVQSTLLKATKLGMDRGTVLRNKGSGETFVVVGTFHGCIIAAKTISICNPSEWETVTRNYEGWRVPPTLIDKADGIDGHYTIGRSKDGTTFEYWDARCDLWCSAGSLFDFETGNNLLIKWNVRTAII